MFVVSSYRNFVIFFQECEFKVGSYIHDATQIFFNGSFGHDTVNQRAQQYEIEIKELDDIAKTMSWAGRNFSYTGFKVSLKYIVTYTYQCIIETTNILT